MEKRKNRNMETMRKSTQGLVNIIRFNWHFYVIALVTMLVLLSFQHKFANICCVLIFFTSLLSLFVSYWVYDVSGFYDLNWLDQFEFQNIHKIINIHAGFDETSAALYQRFPKAELLIYDFYDEKKHTEISIKRARAYYPNHIGTQKIQTTDLPNHNQDVDLIFLIFAAHEIRNDNERIHFFKALHQMLKPSGQIILVEHFRDLPNFLAYNIGFFHFLSSKTWSETFQDSNFKVHKKTKHTPFVNIYSINKHDVTY